MDKKKIIGEMAARHGHLLTEDDPVFLMADISVMAVEGKLQSMAEMLDPVEKRFRTTAEFISQQTDISNQTFKENIEKSAKYSDLVAQNQAKLIKNTIEIFAEKIQEGRALLAETSQREKDKLETELSLAIKDRIKIGNDEAVKQITAALTQQTDGLKGRLTELNNEIKNTERAIERLKMDAGMASEKVKAANRESSWLSSISLVTGIVFFSFITISSFAFFILPIFGLNVIFPTQ